MEPSGKPEGFLVVGSMEHIRTDQGYQEVATGDRYTLKENQATHKNGLEITPIVLTGRFLDRLYRVRPGDRFEV